MMMEAWSFLPSCFSEPRWEAQVTEQAEELDDARAKAPAIEQPAEKS